MSYKIAHIGSFHRNLGDNVALYNVQKETQNRNKRRVEKPPNYQTVRKKLMPNSL